MADEAEGPVFYSLGCHPERSTAVADGVEGSAVLRIQMQPFLQTDRLLLRRWRDSDRLPFQAMNADPRVMEFFPSLLVTRRIRALVDRAQSHFDRHGYGPFAVELLEDHSFIGFIGLSIPNFDGPFMPAVEIGWTSRV